MSNSETGHGAEKMGQIDGTSSRAHAPYSVGGCPIVPRDTSAGRDTGEAGQDSRPSGPTVPSRWQALGHDVDLVPWPSYDAPGGPWWSVTVRGDLGRFTLGWSSGQGKFAGGIEPQRLGRKSRALLAQIERDIRARVGPRPMTWLHIAALNLIADHDAGIAVNPVKLEAARKLVAA